MRAQGEGGQARGVEGDGEGDGVVGVSRAEPEAVERHQLRVALLAVSRVHLPTATATVAYTRLAPSASSAVGIARR